MTWIVAKIKWIMLASGLVTCAALYAAILPQEALRYLFDKTQSGALAEVLVRDWAVLTTLVGAMLIYGAFEPQVRNLVLVVAGVSKLAFLGLVLGYGRRFLEEKVGIAIGVDMAMVALFVTFMIGWRRIGTRRSGPAPKAAPSMVQQAMPPTPHTAVRIPAPSPSPRPPMVKAPGP